jgi:hypothetical protein
VHIIAHVVYLCVYKDIYIHMYTRHTPHQTNSHGEALGRLDASFPFGLFSSFSHVHIRTPTLCDLLTPRRETDESDCPLLLTHTPCAGGKGAQKVERITGQAGLQPVARK